MSKSLNNYIGLNDKPEDMFGKVMSIPDGLIRNYFELLTDTSMEEIDTMEKSMKDGLNPRDIKKKLAFDIVAKYVNEDGAKYGLEYFEKSFGADKAIPYEAHKYQWNFSAEEISISDILKEVKAAASNSDARRMVEQGGFYINEKKIDDFKRIIKKSEMPFTFKAGKKNFGTFE
jgi:tyrosyl-tRNA synthetase